MCDISFITGRASPTCFLTRVCLTRPTFLFKLRVRRNSSYRRVVEVSGACTICFIYFILFLVVHKRSLGWRNETRKVVGWNNGAFFFLILFGFFYFYYCSFNIIFFSSLKIFRIIFFLYICFLVLSRFFFINFFVKVKSISFFFPKHVISCSLVL